MTLLIFFAVVFATIIFAIVLERIIHCPILVGFAFFAIFLIVAAIYDSVTLVIIAIGLGILAFIVAFLDCTLRNTGFFRDNGCLSCECNNNSENNSDDTLTILNSNGRVVARINGNNVICNSNNNGCGCNNSGINFASDNGNITLSDGNILTTSNDISSNCGCGRNNRYRKF